MAPPQLESFFNLDSACKQQRREINPLKNTSLVSRKIVMFWPQQAIGPDKELFLFILGGLGLEYDAFITFIATRDLFVSPFSVDIFYFLLMNFETMLGQRYHPKLIIYLSTISPGKQQFWS